MSFVLKNLNITTYSLFPVHYAYLKLLRLVAFYPDKSMMQTCLWITWTKHFIRWYKTNSTNNSFWCTAADKPCITQSRASQTFYEVSILNMKVDPAGIKSTKRKQVIFRCKHDATLSILLYFVDLEIKVTSDCYLITATFLFDLMKIETFQKNFLRIDYRNFQIPLQIIDKKKTRKYVNRDLCSLIEKWKLKMKIYNS